jgi:hypothetical protein
VLSGRGTRCMASRPGRGTAVSEETATELKVLHAKLARAREYVDYLEAAIRELEIARELVKAAVTPNETIAEPTP